MSNYGRADAAGYSLINKNGAPNLKRYKASLDYSLDLIKLRDVYNRTYRNNRFSFFTKNKEYSSSVLSVTFDYSVRDFNRTGTNIYVKTGVSLEGILFDSGLAQIDGEVVAIQVGEAVSSPPPHINLPKYFYYEDGCYHIKQNVRTVASSADIRKKLYRDGFVCSGVKYVRWKRSSGSARVGKCLFIDEKLYSRIHRWEMCGLNISRGDSVDLAALESYTSLTLSSIIGTLQLKPENILVVDDYNSIFDDEVVNVVEESGRLVARNERTSITNSIFDGESIIDKSAMGEYQTKGMILLRNRFFKSCCFNGNIQRWFSDNNITDVSQLHGFTLAKSISDVKLITTPSSIKYLKFSTLKQWFKNLDDTFGVVKYEKPTHFLDGTLVQTHYQLINSIQMTKSEVQKLLEPSFNLMNLINEHPEVLRYWIKFELEDNIEASLVKSKTDVIYKMMSVNENFCKTKLYYDFKSDLLKSFANELKCGHVLVNGNYSTLCGNPIELLMQSIGTFVGEPVMDAKCVYSKRFDWGTKILGSRSPHITMSNVLLTENKYNEAIDKYMNPTDAIVYINSIGENILQKLAGADFDSDNMLLTDHKGLISAALRNDDKFPVAVSNVGGSKKSRRYTTDCQSDLDIRTSENLIGHIINMSQELNSMIWDILASGGLYSDVWDIYLDVCKLSIMSGIEIDKAKKEFIIDNARELNIIRKKHKLTNDGKSIKPKFFAHISRRKGYYNPEKKEYIKHNTAMDYLQHSINVFRRVRAANRSKKEFLPFSAVINKKGYNYGGVNDCQLKKIFENADLLNAQVSAIYADLSSSALEKRAAALAARCAFMDYIGNVHINHNTVVALLTSIEKEKNKKYRRLLFYGLFSSPNSCFYKTIIRSKSELFELHKNPTGDILIFGNNYSKFTKKSRKSPPSQNLQPI